LNRAINAWLIHPWGPISVLKAAATTTVGRIKGNRLMDRSPFRPGKSNLAKSQAAGKPTNSVRRVERVA